MRTTLECTTCGINFSRRDNFKRHQRVFHSEKLECTKCGITFAQKFNLILHKKRFHNFEPEPVKKEVKIFYSEDEFANWKKDIEQKTYARFVKPRGKIVDVHGIAVTYYICDRSGTHLPAPNKKKNVQSKKIGAVCPARIKTVTRCMFGGVEITVTFWPEHEGHSLSLPEKRVKGVRKGQGFRKKHKLNVSGSNSAPTKKTNLLFLLDKNDASSVDTTVKKLQEGSDNPILLYKAQGVTQEDLPQFGREEFLLGIMNDVQLGLLMLYGNSIVKIDSTHSKNARGFHLTSLMVSSANQEALPVAILLSNLETKEVYQTFFQKIKERLKEEDNSIFPQVFISDDVPALYDAWKITFGPTTNQLVCTWHIERALKGILQKKIGDQAIREIVSKEVNSLLHEIDQINFEAMLKCLTNQWLSHDSTKSFGEYFAESYGHHPHLWAYCYRQWVGISTTMKLGTWYREIKNEAANGKIMNKLDQTLHAVSYFINRKLMPHIINVHPLKLTAKVAGLDQRHQRSLEMSQNIIYEVKEGKKWIVPASKNDGPCLNAYEVERRRETCIHDCGVRCSVCNACIHLFSCTCIDNVIKMQMCKHIHKVCTVFPHVEVQNEDMDHDLFEMTIDIDSAEEEELEEFHQQMDSLTNIKSECISMLHTAVSKIETLATHEQLTVARKLCTNFISSLDVCGAR